MQDQDFAFTASEVATYVFCPAAWNLCRNPERDRRRKEGLRKHAEKSLAFGRYVAALRDGNRYHILFLTIMVTVAAVYLVTFETGFHLGPWPTILVGGLILSAMGVAAFDLFKSLRCGKIARQQEEKLGIKGVNIPYYDLTFASEKHGLVGRPDAVEEEPDGTLTPLEYKDQKAPTHMHAWPNHEMQVAAQCLLLWDATGNRPRQGTLLYTDGPKTIPFDEPLQSRALQVLESMRSHSAANPPRRHHTNERQCMACVVRDGCEQSLFRHRSTLH